MITVLAASFTSTKSKEINENQSSKNVEFSKIDFRKEYEIIDEKFKTETVVRLKDSKRYMSTNSLPNHKTGAFPNEGNPNTIKAQNIKYEFTLSLFGEEQVGTRAWSYG